MLQSMLHFTLESLLAHGYKEANTAFVRPTAVHPSLHAILYSRLGRKILSGIVVLFRLPAEKFHNGKRGEGRGLLWEATDIHDNLDALSRFWTAEQEEAI